MVKGEGFASIGGNKPLKGRGKIFDKSMRLSKALRKSAEASNPAKANPADVMKGWSPDFLAESNFQAALSAAPQNQAMAGFVGQLNQILSAELGKTISLTSPLTTGLVPYDLVAPSRLIYPVFSPMRNKLPRTAGQGTSRKVKVLTGISGSHTGGTSVLDWSIPEFPGGGSFSNWPNQLPGTGSQTAVDVSIPYKFFGLTEALSWLAQFSGQGFEDISALANLVLLQEAMLAEEHMLLEGANTVAATPGTPTLAARSAATGETALTGVTNGQNVYVVVTGVNFFGETVASSVASIAWATGQVIDVTISPSNGSAVYNIYASTGTTQGTNHLFTSGVGGHKFTLQGAMPTGGATPPSADTGSGSTNRYDGLMTLLTGRTASGTYPTSGYKGGYINQAVGGQLTNAVFQDAFAGLWNNSSTLNTSDSGGFRADPQEIILEGLDASNYAANVLSQSAGGQQAYQLFITQDQTGDIRTGAAISQIQNSITRSLVKLVVHPWLQQGNAFVMSYNLPQSVQNVGNAWEVTNVQDYVSITWPVIDVTFRYSIFLYGTLVGIAPQYSGILQGIQKSGTAAGGNWT